MKRTLNKLAAVFSALFILAVILTATNAVAVAPAALAVDTTTDDASLSACTAAANDCSLRGAIAASPPGATINFDAGVFASARTITLNGTEIAVNKSLTITGTGANLLTIDGNGAKRIFTVSNGAAVVLEKMTLTRGNAAGTSGATGPGGAIYSLGGNNLTLNNMVVSGNTANLSGGAIFTTGTNAVVNINNSTVSGNTAGAGGAVEQLNGAVNISGSFIVNNTATSGSGGGIDSPISKVLLTVVNSVISGNSANSTNGSAYGGGIYQNYFSQSPSQNAFGNYNLFIKNSTVSNNSATLVGGICVIVNNQGDGTSEILLQNSTVSGNAANQGDGFYNQGVAANVVNSTVANNTCGGGCSCGGGIVSLESAGIINLLNTIIVANNGSTNPDVAVADNGAGAGKFVSYGSNLIGVNDDGSIYTAASGDQIGTSASPVNARLQPLGNYGGATQTHALLSNSPAKDAGSDCVSTAACTGINPTENLTADQRGASRVGSADIGAFEYNTTNYVAALPGGKTGQLYSQTIVPNTTQNNTTYSCCYTGAPPPGLSGIAPCQFSSARAPQKYAVASENAESDSRVMLDGATAALVVAGTPTTGGTYSFSLLAADGNGGSGATNYSINVVGNAPTAASVTVSGRASAANGRGMSGVRVTMTDMNGDTKTATPDRLGYYRFREVDAGETYIFSAKAKSYEFREPSQVLNVNEETADVNFTVDRRGK